MTPKYEVKVTARQMGKTTEMMMAENEALRAAAVFAAMTLDHALALGYCGEGSTKGLAEDAVEKLNEALKTLPLEQPSQPPTPSSPDPKGGT